MLKRRVESKILFQLILILFQCLLMSSFIKNNFGCACDRNWKKLITYENNDLCKLRLVIVLTLHIEFNFSLKVFFLFSLPVWHTSQKISAV